MSSAPNPAHRFFVSEGAVSAGGITFSAAQQQQIRKVLRLRDGDRVIVCPGDRTELFVLLHVAGQAVSGEIEAMREGLAEPRRPVWLYQSALRGERFTWLLQKGTEIGVSAFTLVASRRVEAPPPSPSRLSRYERIVMEACKQSRRRVLPALTLGSLEPPGEGVVAILLAHAAGAGSLGAVLAVPKPKEVWIAVGPEGGFAEDEIAAAVSSGWRRASLGPRVLRTETAGAVAAAIVLHTWGDLGSTTVSRVPPETQPSGSASRAFKPSG